MMGVFHLYINMVLNMSHTHTPSLDIYIYLSRLLYVRRSAPVALDYTRFSPARFTPSIEAFPFMYICIFRTIYGTTRVRR